MNYDSPLPLPYGFVKNYETPMRNGISIMKVGDTKRLKTTKDIHYRFRNHEKKYGYKFSIQIEPNGAVVTRVE